MLQLLATLPLSNDNGLALTPPLGWRSWNLFGADVSQKLIMSIMDGMVRRDRLVDGVPTSLCDLGYCDVGLDDNWQKCGEYGRKKGTLTSHDEHGTPMVNTKIFPDLKAMTDHAHKLGLTAGWYANNCICREHATDHTKFYRGDIQALREYGFDGIKLDGCGSQLDMQLYDDLIKATPAQSGRDAILVENCHWGDKEPFKPNATWCPWNMYRTSHDLRARYASVVGNLHSTDYYARHNLSYPGCWAYADMLEVGVYDGKGLPQKASKNNEHDPGLSREEMRTNYAAWAIVSSPLILSTDINNETIMDIIWPIIANREAIAINQAWAGHSGSVFKKSGINIELDAVNYAKLQKYRKVANSEYQVPMRDPMIAPSYEYYYKPLEKHGAKTAVLMMNHGHAHTRSEARKHSPFAADQEVDLTLHFKDIPGVSCTRCHVRDVWRKRDLGDFDGSYVAKGVAPHAAPFLVITPSATTVRDNALVP